MPSERVVRPSMKLVYVGYVVGAIIYIAAAYLYFVYLADKPAWLLAIPLLVFYPAVKGHILRSLISFRIDEDHLTLDKGFISRSRRTLDLAKIQDVTVEQTVWERLLGVGDISLESAGETGGLEIDQVDNPRGIADLILERSRKAADSRAHGV